MTTTISRRDTAFLKGLAIVAIVMHNFCHWIPGSVVENEYNFSLQNTVDLLDVLQNGCPHVVLNLFSYFGCYGVPVFLFISGYGVVKKYEAEKNMPVEMPSVWRFARYNALKLWRLMLAGVLMLYLYETIFTTGWRHGYMNIVWLFTFLSNFFPQISTGVLPKQDLLLGPWWYFSLTMQMYMLYRLWYYGRGKAALISAALVCVVLQVLSVTIFSDSAQTMLHYMRYTLLACLLPFGFGVWTARYGFRSRAYIYIICVAVFAASLFNVFAWIVAPLALAVLALPLVKIDAAWLRKPLEWLGGISAALFVVHPVVRCFFNPRMGGDVYPMLAEYIATSVALAWLLTKLMSFIPKPKL